MNAESMGFQEDRRAQAMVETLEDAATVRRRNQFFLWTQGSFQTILPHDLVVCGYYDRSSKQVRLDAFNSTVVPAAVLTSLTDGKSPLMQYLINRWINNSGSALSVPLSTMPRAVAIAADAMRSARFSDLLLHGVSRPHRVDEIETFFLFASTTTTPAATQRTGVELMLPHLHQTYLRVQAVELELAKEGVCTVNSGSGFSGADISERELQVLAAARQGLSNQEIGQKLRISPLTVKNHIQKILRKLGASNRAQAVARAITLRILAHGASD